MMLLTETGNPEQGRKEFERIVAWTDFIKAITTADGLDKALGGIQEKLDEAKAVNAETRERHEKAAADLRAIKKISEEVEAAGKENSEALSAIRSEGAEVSERIKEAEKKGRDLAEHEASFTARAAGKEKALKDREDAVTRREAAAAEAQKQAESLKSEYEGKLAQLKGIVGKGE